MKLRRREFLQVIGGAALTGCATTPNGGAEAEEPIIDIHQHTNYHGRADTDLVRHQEAMGVTTTVLLPAGRYYGLDAQCGGNESVQRAAARFPKRFVFFSNELPYLREADAVIRQNLIKGAKGIGEQKFRVLADSKYLERIARIAQDFEVPILLHFQDGDYNMELQRFHKILEKYPKVNFIGHAQTWWGHIDRKHDPSVMYPKGDVTAGGITDRLLADYPNMFGDLSAGSGLNSLKRDPGHTVGFLRRHQDKLLFGSDCQDVEGRGANCVGSQILEMVRKHAGSKTAERKILYENSKRLLRL